MARIIKKGYQLEKEYYEIRKAQVAKSTDDLKKFGVVTFVAIMIYAVAVIIGAIVDKFIAVFLPATICFGMVLMIIAVVYLSDNILNRPDTDILISGIHGERNATKLLETLPDYYTVFQNVILVGADRESEIDNIVVGKSGVFIIEVKNHNGHIVGDLNDKYWTQHKMGRGGIPYTKTMYSPVKQVGTHIYHLANYFRQSGINTYIEGMVYFANKDCELSLIGNSGISVYSSSGDDEECLCRQIKSGKHNLDVRSVKRICEMIDQL